MVFEQLFTPPPTSVRPQALATLHSFRSAQVSLSVPEFTSVKPAPQVQLKLPEEFEQLLTPKSRRQAVEDAHSFVSTQVALKPEPEGEKPAPQEQL